MNERPIGIAKLRREYRTQYIVYFTTYAANNTENTPTSVSNASTLAAETESVWTLEISLSGAVKCCAASVAYLNGVAQVMVTVQGGPENCTFHLLDVKLI